MSETYIVTAKSVEEAVSIANAKYADESHEVSYDIIEMPKKGFLGLGAKEAKIKVTVSETVSASLNSLVADIRSMKNLTDRGGDEKHAQKPGKQDKQKQGEKQGNQNGNQNGNQQKQDKQKQNNDRNNQNKQNNKQNKQNNKDNQQKQSKAQEVKPEKQAEPKAEEKNQNKTRLNNQALPGKRSKQRKSAPTDADISASAVTVNAPANLSEFVSEKPAASSFGSSERTSGRMNNDIRRGKKNAQNKPQSTETRDRQMRDSKYDVAETDEAYKSLENLERENENLLEREAFSALGLGEKEAAEAAPETRTREAVTEDEMKYALEFANTLLKNMQIGAEAVAMQCPEDEELIVTETATVYPKINIVGDDSGILIGHHGETLDSIQYLVNLCALRKTKSKDGDYVKIVVDIENYRNKREDTLRSLAKRMAAKAVKYKRNVFLEPMNAYERRIIHSELQKYPNVSTHSVGSDRDRKIIITYEGADKAPESKNRRRRSGKGGKGGQHKNGGRKEETKAEVSAEAKSAIEAEKKNPRRPRKVQKLTIDKLDDLLDGNESVKITSADEE